LPWSPARRAAPDAASPALAEAGATVYCTGRSIRGNPLPYKRPETIDETAEMIQAAGGIAIPIRVDQSVETGAARRRASQQCGRWPGLKAQRSDCARSVSAVRSG
jgi:hypothetical protein